MKKFIIAIIVLAAVAGSAGAYYKYRNPAVETKVSTLAVSRGDIVEAVGATGTLQAVTTVQVGSQVSGNIKALYADFNSIVRKGQIVAELDPSLLQTQIEQARANLARSQADLDRLKVTLEDARSKLKRTENLAARKLIAPHDLEAAQVAVRSAEAQIKSAEASVVQSQASLSQNEVNLQHTVIEAPIDGIVISRNVDVGQTVAASMNAPVLFIIAADLAKMQVNANVDESDVGRIRPGQVVKFRVDAYPLEEFVGSVSQVRLQPIVSQNVVTYATVIDVPNPQLKLKPGMTANVTIEIARRTDVMRVPNASLRFRPTNDIFAALNQPVPPEMQRGAGGAGGFGGRQGAQGGPGAATQGAAGQGGSTSAATPGQGSGSRGGAPTTAATPGT
ncbi:MAG: efflux RND transporter periplasmic adaptor subunit, partial [Acidobacteria bacterium]|nr:efflux RND transporter periplasmic adaptor subunit [Acidobacteriota bacterium]